ncbi:MAG TPA: hypothetical protein VGA61_07655 [Anaerolineae bacterium]
MKPKVHPYVPELQDLHRQGKISRREFMRFAGLLGVTSAAAEALIAGPTLAVDAPAAATADGEGQVPPAAPPAAETSQATAALDPNSLPR